MISRLWAIRVWRHLEAAFADPAGFLVLVLILLIGLTASFLLGKTQLIGFLSVAALGRFSLIISLLIAVSQLPKAIERANRLNYLPAFGRSYLVSSIFIISLVASLIGLAVIAPLLIAGPDFRLSFLTLANVGIILSFNLILSLANLVALIAVRSFLTDRIIRPISFGLLIGFDYYLLGTAGARLSGGDLVDPSVLIEGLVALASLLASLIFAAELLCQHRLPPPRSAWRFWPIGLWGVNPLLAFNQSESLFLSQLIWFARSKALYWPIGLLALITIILAGQVRSGLIVQLTFSLLICLIILRLASLAGGQAIELEGRFGPMPIARGKIWLVLLLVGLLLVVSFVTSASYASGEKWSWQLILVLSAAIGYFSYGFWQRKSNRSTDRQEFSLGEASSLAFTAAMVGLFIVLVN